MRNPDYILCEFRQVFPVLITSCMAACSPAAHILSMVNLERARRRWASIFFLRRGSGFLITFSQTADRIRADAASLGLNIASVTILDLTPPAETFSEMESYDIFSAAEVEREPISRQSPKLSRKRNPSRIFVDSFGFSVISRQTNSSIAGLRNRSFASQRCEVPRSSLHLKTSRRARRGWRDPSCISERKAARSGDEIARLRLSRGHARDASGKSRSGSPSERRLSMVWRASS